MAELKTKPTEASVDAYLQAVEDDTRRQDSLQLREILERITGARPVMWGASLIGFGDYRYKYASGREGDWFLVGFAPRKANLALYLMPGFDRYEEILSRLGKYKTGKGCLYIKRLADVDLDVLEELVNASVAYLRSQG